MITAYATIQILGKDPSGYWYEIQYPQAKTGVGWVTSQYVNVQNARALQVVAIGSGAGLPGVITQQVNVRSGPGTEAGSVGILNARDLVNLTGKDPGGLWLQIHFAGAADGKGWVAAGYVQASGIEQLPVIGQAGQVIGTETPTGVPPTAIPTAAVAADDHDSADSPAVDVTLSPTGARSFIYSSALSAPTGDAADWIRFRAYGGGASIRLDCSAPTLLKLHLTLDGNEFAGPTLPTCGSSGTLALVSGRQYLLEISLAPAQGAAQYIQYTVAIETQP